MDAPGIPIDGMMVGVMGKIHETINTSQGESSQGPGCWRLLPKGGCPSDKATG